MRHPLVCIVCGLLAAVSQPASAASDADFAVVVNPTTGAALLRNDSAAPLTIDGYLLRSPDGVLNGDGWVSLEDNAVDTWAEGPASAGVLSEVNLFNSLTVPVGGTVDIGAPYAPFSPTQIGDPEPALDFSYSVLGEGVFTGDVEFEVSNNVVLVIDRGTGESFLENQSQFAVEIDSYLILSGAGSVEDPGAVLNPAGWTRLEDSLGLAGGWVASPGSETRIGEGNLLGSTLLGANGGSLALGNAINPLALEDETDLTLEFSIAPVGGGPGRSVPGNILFVGDGPDQPDGDYNGDGVVDAADYTVWRDNLGQDVTLPNDTTPGQVTNDDYQVWFDNFGATATVAASTSAAAVVPEPGVITLVASGLVAAFSVFSRRRG